MLINIGLLLIGLMLVAKGGDLFVDSSVDIAKGLKIPRIVIGATLVSLGTTVPELIVSVTASSMGDPGIALGNAVGSAIANIGLVVGVIALMGAVKICTADFKIRSKWMIFSALLVIVFSSSFLISKPKAIILFVLGIMYLAFDYWRVSRNKKNNSEAVEEPFSGSLKKVWLLFITGLIMVVVGSRALVLSGIAIAHGLGISSAIIGLSIIAFGTSLPELVTAIISSRKGVSDLSIGNVVGANVLNLAMITGLAGMINPLTITAFTRNYSYPWLIFFVIAMTAIFWNKGKIKKWQGGMFIVFYGLYVAGLFLLPLFSAN